MNCIKTIKPIESMPVSERDIIFALLKDTGCYVSNMPDTTYGQTVYSNRWELFDPEKVRLEDCLNLPEPWARVYEMHNKPDMHDCVRFRYRYIHAPKKILTSYPKIPVSGIFCLTSRSVRLDKIKAENLTWIGDNF